MIEDVPGYQMLGQIGEGGFSVVYRAHQERLDRTVALKVLSISTVDADAMRRFQRECKITARLSDHPNIVTVLDNGTTRSGRPYIAMEYFEHGALTDRLTREGPLPVGEVLRIGVKMAGALAATHETDVLHRDVKPQNILISRYGEPALTDFGIARLVDSFDASLTQAFTPYHAAPEVLEGRPPGVGSDVYSLGSTLYQLLAGKPAFKGPPGEGIAPLMLRALHEAPPPIARPDMPAQVTEAIVRAMAKTPEQRFANALEFARHLRKVQSDLGLPVTELAHSGAADAAALASSPEAFTHPRPPAVAEWVSTMPATAAGPAAPGGTVADAPPPAGPGSPQTVPSPEGPHGGPPTQPQPERPRSGDGPRRGLIIAVAATLVGGVTVGIGALALQGAFSGTPEGGDPTGARSASPSGTRPPQDQQAPIPAAQVQAARPRKVRIKAFENRAVLTWTVPPAARQLPIIVQALPASSAPTVSAGQGARSATVPGLKPKTAYCFRVGALLRLNQGKPASMSWSRPPVCIRDTRVQKPRTP